MKYKISKPSSFLSQYVKHYWSLENSTPIGKAYSHRIVPSGLFELIFYLADKPTASDSSKSISDSLLVTGQVKNFYDLKISGKLSLFSINFQPHGLAMFLEIPLNELFDQSVPLRFIIKDTVNKLEEDLSGTNTHEERRWIAEEFLISQLGKNETKYNYQRIRRAVNQINNAKGIMDIESLASESFLSRKQFERTFADIIGASPKQFMKVVRFQNAIYEKSQHAELSLTELAYKCGYFDQSHMINDFKKLSGTTPKQFFADCEPFSDYFE